MLEHTSGQCGIAMRIGPNATDISRPRRSIRILYVPSLLLLNRAPVAADSPRNGNSECGVVVSRLGFEPRARGVEVSAGDVHGVLWRSSASISSAWHVYGLHPVGWGSTAVAVNVAVSLVVGQFASARRAIASSVLAQTARL